MQSTAELHEHRRALTALLVLLLLPLTPFPSLGQSSGPSLAIEALGADLSLLGPTSGELSFTSFGRATSTCDLNEDGIDDLIVGAVVGGRPGGALVVYGNNSFPTSSIGDLASEADIAILPGAQAFGAGFAVACGDVNGDAHKDIVLGAWGACHGDPLDCGGEAYVIYGSQTWPPVIDLAVTPPDVTMWGKTTFDSQGFANPDELGKSLAVADLNGDFIGDIVMGTPGNNGPDGLRAGSPGAVYVVYGSTGLPALINFAADTPDLLFYGAEGGAGIAVTARDTDGDGFADLLISATGGKGPDNTRVNGEAYIVYGSGALPAVMDALEEVGPPPDVIIYGGAGTLLLGDAFSISTAVCDLNNDGENDLLFGARTGGDEVGRPQAGAVFIFFGGSLPAVLDVAGEVGPPADAVVWGANGGGNFGDDLLGHQVACGDVNGDGTADILVVAERGDAPFFRQAEGAIYVYYGSAALPAVMDVRGELGPAPDVILYSGGGLANTAPPFLKVAAGDVNGDGIDELIAGAPLTFLPPTEAEPDGRSLAGAVFVFNIPRLAALPEPPAATKAHYNRRKRRLKITVPGATGDEIVEINGHLVGPWWTVRKEVKFKPDTSQFILKGRRSKLFLGTPGLNSLVIIKDGRRSAPLFF